MSISLSPSSESTAFDPVLRWSKQLWQRTYKTAQSLAAKNRKAWTKLLYFGLTYLLRFLVSDAEGFSLLSSGFLLRLERDAPLMLLLSHQENQLHRSWALYSLHVVVLHIQSSTLLPHLELIYKHHLLNMCQFSDCLVAAPENTDLIVKPYFSPNIFMHQTLNPKP